MVLNWNVTALFAGQSVPTEATVVAYSRSEAMKRGVRGLLYCWGAALLTLPVPVLHLVLPPLLFVGGLVALGLVYVKSKKLPKRLEGDVVCTNCQAKTHYLFESASPPYYSACESCKVGYEVIVKLND